MININKKIILTLMLGIIMISLVSATDLPTGKQDSNITLIQYCPTCTYVTLSSITYPDNSLQILDENMTKSGSTFSYNFSDTSQLGPYIYFIEGDKDSVKQGETLTFQITPSGSVLDISGSIVFFVIFLIIFAALIGCVYGLNNALVAEWQIFYICTTYLLTFSIFFISWLFSTYYLWQTPIIASIFWILWLVSAICFFPVIIILGSYLLKKQAEFLMAENYGKQGYSSEDSLSMASST